MTLKRYSLRHTGVAAMYLSPVYIFTARIPQVPISLVTYLLSYRGTADNAPTVVAIHSS